MRSGFWRRERARILAMAVLSVLAGCSAPSQQDIRTAQALEDVELAFTDIQVNIGEMHDRIDSLASVVIRQDSLIRVLSNLAGVQVR